MPPHIRASIATLVGLVLTSGCALWETPPAVRTDQARPPAVATPTLANDRTVFPDPAPKPDTPPVDAIRLAGAEATVEPPPSPAPSEPMPVPTVAHAPTPTDAASPGVPLDYDRCRCLAAQSIIPVRLLGQEMQIVGLAAERAWFGDPHGFAVHQQILLYRAEVRRNEAAAAALDLFFHIAQAER